MTTSSNRRLTWTTVVVGLAFATVAASQIKLQVFERKSTIDLAIKSQKYLITKTIYAKRGCIYSADGRPLAEDSESSQLGVEFARVPNSIAFFAELGEASGVPACELVDAANSGVSGRTWSMPLTAAQCERVAEVKYQWRADGVSLGRGGVRTYPLGEIAAGIIGRMDADAPVNGMELKWNDVLAGSNGKSVGLVDGSGTFLPSRMSSTSVSSQDGRDIALTIDSNLQALAAQAIKKCVVDNKAEHGVAIVMDPSTGDVKAMANYPTFDPNSNGRTEPGERTSDFNAAVSAKLEPGSMFKILTLAKGLDDHKVDPNAEIDCKGEMIVKYDQWRVRCDSHHGNRAHGLVDAKDAIARSCNISAAHWAMAIGFDPFTQYIRDLGLETPTDIGLPYERQGYVNPNDWARELELADLGFGQSISATPVELASAFSMLANGGVRMKPRLIARIGAKQIPTESLGRVVREESANTVKEYMKAVIQSEEGTGKDLRIPGYVLAGKTGTAQKIGVKNGGYVSNFVGFVPADKPRAVILVMIDRPSGAFYYGATVAGPVFRELAQGVIRQYGIPATEPLPSRSAASKSAARKATAQ